MQAPMLHLHFWCGAPNVANMIDENDEIIRKSVSLPASLWQRIEDYQFAERVKRDAEAIRRLLDMGLEAYNLSKGEKASPKQAPKKRG